MRILTSITDKSSTRVRTHYFDGTSDVRAVGVVVVDVVGSDGGLLFLFFFFLLSPRVCE